MQTQIGNELYWIRSTGRRARINGRLMNEYELRKKLDDRAWYQYANIYAKTIKEIVNEIEEELYCYCDYDDCDCDDYDDDF